uniref:SelT/SelW/SelH family protein n=1 Tax=Salmonella sp. s51933 TaxID=3160127 RepID=UPI003754D9AB
GYKSKFNRLRADLEDQFDEELEFTSHGTEGVTGWFEVEINGKLVHSKKDGDGYVDSQEKMKKITKSIEEALSSK